jgi:folate-binding protein YgfZ
MSTWLDFLSTQNYSRNGHPDPAPEHPRLIPMTEHRLLQVTGPDAVKFLQGQVTCDLRRLEQQDHLLGAHCNAKGRMISSFTLAGLDGGEAIGLRLRGNLADAALAALRKYIVFSKARIEASTLVPLAILGNLGGLPIAALPATGKYLALNDGTAILRHADDHLELWAPETAAPGLWQSLIPTCFPADPYWLERLQVERGLAEVQALTAEEFVPQMFNYHLVDGVSFKKGCYTGQEIVARMQYRGQLKKHTYCLHCEQPLDLDVGATLVAADDEKNLATVVAAASGPEGWLGLVVANSETQENEAFLRDKKTGAKLHWLPLPYAIPKQ